MEEKLIAEAQTSFGLVTVVRVTVYNFCTEYYYEVRVDGVVKHPNLNAHAAIRALAFYLQGEGYRAMKAQK